MHQSIYLPPLHMKETLFLQLILKSVTFFDIIIQIQLAMYSLFFVVLFSCMAGNLPYIVMFSCLFFSFLNEITLYIAASCLA